MAVSSLKTVLWSADRVSETHAKSKMLSSLRLACMRRKVEELSSLRQTQENIYINIYIFAAYAP